VVTVEDDRQEGEPLLRQIMEHGRPVRLPTLQEARTHASRQLERLPAPLRSLGGASPYAVEISPALRALADEVDRWTGLKPQPAPRPAAPVSR
jgi:nicotinate phosphoribosyltransferase